MDGLSASALTTGSVCGYTLPAYEAASVKLAAHVRDPEVSTNMPRRYRFKLISSLSVSCLVRKTRKKQIYQLFLHRLHQSLSNFYATWHCIGVTFICIEMQTISRKGIPTRHNYFLDSSSHEMSSRQLPPGGMHTPISPKKAGFDLEDIPPKLIVIGVDFGMTHTGK